MFKKTSSNTNFFAVHSRRDLVTVVLQPLHNFSIRAYKFFSLRWRGRSAGSLVWKVLSASSLVLSMRKFRETISLPWTLLPFLSRFPPLLLNLLLCTKLSIINCSLLWICENLLPVAISTLFSHPSSTVGVQRQCEVQINPNFVWNPNGSAESNWCAQSQ